MKHLLKLGTVFQMLLLLGSCNNSEKQKTELVKNNGDEQVYSYAIDTTGVSVLWTAYKFTNKVGVSGKFENFKFKVVNKAESIEKLLGKTEIDIYTESVNSNSEIRDPKLRANFFKMFHTDTIKGTIREMNIRKGFLDLGMNNMVKPLEYDYLIKNDTLFLTATIDLKKWDGDAAIHSLNKECYDLHTGTDGISKLWPDVDVIIKLPIKKTLRND